MSHYHDLTGQVFTRLTVIRRAENAKNGTAMFECKCSCGALVIKKGINLRSGSTKSCGCLRFGENADRMRLVPGSHGHCTGGTSPTYYSWKNMRARCLNPKRFAYHRYGGRGISVCDRWYHFENFLQDMGERPEGMCLERIDNNGNYCPENCRWASIKEQTRNTARNVWITHEGVTMCLADWSKKLGGSSTKLYRRLKAGWTMERALKP